MLLTLGRKPPATAALGRLRCVCPYSLLLGHRFGEERFVPPLQFFLGDAFHMRCNHPWLVAGIGEPAGAVCPEHILEGHVAECTIFHRVAGIVTRN